MYIKMANDCGLSYWMISECMGDIPRTSDAAVDNDFDETKRIPESVVS